MTSACWARLLCFTISAKLLIDHDLFQPAEDALAFHKFQTDIGSRLASFQIYCRNTRTGNGAIVLLPLNFNRELHGGLLGD
jgi:hypothetical protein